MLTHGQMAFVVTNHLCDLMPGLTADDASLVVAPLSHGAGIHQLTQVARGVKTVLLPTDRFDVADAWELIERWRVDDLFTVPTILKLLVEHESVDRSRPLLPALRDLCRRADVPRGPEAGAGEARAGARPVLRPRRGDRQHHRAAAARLHAAEDGPEVKLGTCGYERTGMQLQVQDEDGGELAAGRDRRDLRRSARRSSPATTTTPRPTRRRSATAGSAPATSGHVDEQGFLYITGRASDMYISGGSNVYPREIEEKILTHPGITEVAVVGVPDPLWGEVGVAVCVAARRRDRDRGRARRLPRRQALALQASEALRLLGGAAEVRLRQDHQEAGPRGARPARPRRRGAAVGMTIAIARLAHPGPRAPDRRQAAPATLRPLAGRLRAGRPVMDEVARLFADGGCRGGMLWLDGVVCDPMRFVLPALATDDQHAAFYSATHAPDGPVRIGASTASVGWRDGAPFLHCHGQWSGGFGAAMGHLLPLQLDRRRGGAGPRARLPGRLVRGAPRPRDQLHAVRRRRRRRQRRPRRPPPTRRGRLLPPSPPSAPSTGSRGRASTASARSPSRASPTAATCPASPPRCASTPAA